MTTEIDLNRDAAASSILASDVLDFLHERGIEPGQQMTALLLAHEAMTKAMAARIQAATIANYLGVKR